MRKFSYENAWIRLENSDTKSQIWWKNLYTKLRIDCEFVHGKVQIW